MVVESCFDGDWICDCDCERTEPTDAETGREELEVVGLGIPIPSPAAGPVGESGVGGIRPGVCGCFRAPSSSPCPSPSPSILTSPVWDFGRVSAEFEVPSADMEARRGLDGVGCRRGGSLCLDGEGDGDEADMLERDV